jgi:uroporphyrin-III C-methyltransferase
MQVQLDLSGRPVLVVGSSATVRAAVRRYEAAGALVRVTDPAGAASLLRSEPPTTWPGSGSPALVVLVGVDDEMTRTVRQLCRSRQVPLAVERPSPVDGSVTLVGGGPGNADLLTVAATAALREADVVFVDRLAPHDDLATLAPGAEVVDVGKRPYHHPVPQRTIEDLMIERALAGQTVVRLKGGDPFVFGRGGEEVQACMAAGVPVRVVPGITSSVAVPGAAGIPVTHRGISHAFTVISGHVPPSPAELQALADLGGTIVILMGIANLPLISAGLLRAGLPADTPAAAVERGFSQTQRTTYAVLGRLAEDVRRLDVSSPAVVVIGDVVALGSREGFQLTEWADRMAGHSAS